MKKIIKYLLIILIIAINSANLVKMRNKNKNKEYQDTVKFNNEVEKLIKFLPSEVSTNYSTVETNKPLEKVEIVKPKEFVKPVIIKAKPVEIPKPIKLKPIEKPTNLVKLTLIINLEKNYHQARLSRYPRKLILL